MSAVRVHRLLLLGGTSEIGLAIVRRLSAGPDATVALAGRDAAALAAAGDGLRAVGHAGRTEVVEVDALEPAGHRAALERATQLVGGLDVVVVAAGVLGTPGRPPTDAPEEAVDVLLVNAVGVSSLLVHSARELRAQGQGTLVLISSVAAERPRSSNPVYGASKATADTLARLLPGPVPRVLVVRPGFVRTRMTRDLKPAPLSTTPEAVAEATAEALAAGAGVVWCPPAMRVVSRVLETVPHPLFRRLPF